MWQGHGQPREADGLCWAWGCVGRGGRSACERGGGVLFALVAWQLLGYWGISLSCWWGLSGPVWEVEAISSLRHDHIPPSGPAGTLGLRVVGRAGWGCGAGTRPILRG